MFSLFKSKRNKWKDILEKTFNNFIPALKGMNAQEIAQTLDHAAIMRNASLLMSDDDSPYHYAFNEPMKLDNETSLYYLEYWRNNIMELSHNREGVIKIGVLTIWWLSL